MGLLLKKSTRLAVVLMHNIYSEVGKTIYHQEDQIIVEPCILVVPLTSEIRVLYNMLQDSNDQ